MMPTARKTLMKRRGRTLTALLALGFALADDTQATHARADIEPVVLFERGELSACGLRARVEDAGDLLVVSLVAYKSGPVLRFRLEARRPEGTSGPPPVAVSLATTGYDTTRLLRDVAPEAGVAAAEAPLEGLDGGGLMRELMVSGGRVRMQLQDGATREVLLAGPMTQAVRAAYLNCAGDLFRP